MEHLSMCLLIYVKIYRLDLAQQSLNNLLKQADEDSVLA